MKTKFNMPLKDPYKQYDFIDEDLSNSDTSFLAAAAKIAQTSEYRFRMASLIVKSGRVLGGDTNSPKITPDTPPKRVSTHAEIRTIKGVKNTQGSTIYIARLSAEGNTALAKPCVWCMEHIINAGISRVVFTDNDGGGISFHTDMITWDRRI